MTNLPAESRVSSVLELSLDCSAAAEAPGTLCESGSEPSEVDLLRFFESLLPVRQAIVDVGRKLWMRQYVEGNGGNISSRVGNQYVLCTPTMVCKGDLTVDDLCLIDMHGNHRFGNGRPTSEMLLHLAIYRANAAARSVVHCHPPHPTAYAITGQPPPSCVLPEQDIFVGPMAFAPYETPGTKAFADTVLPFVQTHNTILLGNHGIVCWADTVTHAEWCVEIADAYCRTLIIAAQLGKPITQIPAEKIKELLEVKKRVGLPDARLGEHEQPVPGRGWRSLR
jgi:L-fuculose-phosphate aldolase